MRGWGRSFKSLLFLKKKKQKDFYPFMPGRVTPPGIKGMKVFWFFFSKKNILHFACTPRNIPICRNAMAVCSGRSFHGYRLTCALGASRADSMATA